MEGAAGVRVSGEPGCQKGPKSGGSEEGEGATLESEQEKLALPGRGGRRREGGSVGGGGGAGAGAGRGEYNSAVARRGGSCGRPGLQPAPSGAQHPLRLTAEAAEERVAGARRAKLRAVAGERNFAPRFRVPALAQHFSGGSRQPGSVRARRTSVPAGWEDDDDVPEQQAGVQHAARRQPARGAQVLGVAQHLARLLRARGALRQLS